MPYVYNAGKSPVVYGTHITVKPGHYEVLPKETIACLKAANIPLVYEDDPKFQPLWVRSFPAKTPNQILD
jgi:hypothetical protein